MHDPLTGKPVIHISLASGGGLFNKSPTPAEIKRTLILTNNINPEMTGKCSLLSSSLTTNKSHPEYELLPYEDVPFWDGSMISMVSKKSETYQWAC